MAQVTAYVDLCTRLSRFVQLQPSADLNKELQMVMEDLVKLYEHLGSSPLTDKVPIDAPLVGLAAMDDLVMHSLHRLLGSFIRNSHSLVLQEISFGVFARVVRRCKPRMVSDRPGQVQRHLTFVQTCVLYLPSPPEAALDKDEIGFDPVTLSSQSEELRLAILQSLWELLKEPEKEKQIVQLQVDEQLFFAYAVASLLHVAQTGRCREVALKAIEVLKCVFLFVRDPPTLRQYLPGVVAGLWKSANAPHQASKVIVAALQCLSLVLDMCISDGLLPGGRKQKQEQRFTLEAIRHSVSKNGTEKEITTKTSDSVNVRSSEDEKWIEEAATNMDMLFTRMFAASATAFAADGTKTGLPRSSWRVRCALAQLCGTVMLQCRRGLRVSFFRCYDELLVLRGDVIPEVSQEADKVLQKLHTSSLSLEERLQVLPEMADRFQMLLSTLVLKVATEHEATKMHFVRTLRGYVEFLGSSLTPYLDASMESIYTSLCRVVSFATLDIALISHQSLPTLTEASGSSNSSTARVVVAQFQKRLRFFNEEVSVREVLAMVREIGAVLTPAGFIDCAFTLLSDASVVSTQASEVVLVLNEFLRAYCPNKENKVHSDHRVIDVHLTGRILEDLLALNAWDEHSSQASNCASSKVLVSQRAFMVECVGVCAEILGVEFKVFLLHVLYPLVEQLGSRSVEVERAALVALEKVYFFTGYESLEALFQVNMDYFVDALCARLEQLDTYPMTAFVVDALLKHTRLASLPLVDEVATSLLRSVDVYQDSSHIGGLLRALKALLGSIARDVREVEDDAVHTLGDEDLEEPAASRSLLDDFVHELKVLENCGIGILTEDADKEVEPGLEKKDLVSVKAALPLEYDDIQSERKDGDHDNEADNTAVSGHGTLVIDIVDRCGYFLVESDPIACCLVLSLIDEGVRFLSRYRKQLWPLITRMWPELLSRLRVDNRAIVTSTVRVITTVAEAAGDFVGTYFVEKVWPILRSQLQSICFDSDAKSPQLTRSMLLLLKPPSEDPCAVDAQSSRSRIDVQTPAGDEPDSVRGVRKTQEVHQLLAILSCLTMACQQSKTMTPLVPEITRMCYKYLSCSAPQEVVEQTSELVAALAQLNGDEVFCSVAALAHRVPPSPPSARFSGYQAGVVEQFHQNHFSGQSGQTKTCRDNARMLMNRLFE